MFNLIVSVGLRNERSDSIVVSRVFEFTDTAIADRFKPGGNLDVPAVSALPTLFMEEGISNQIARIGWLSHVELRDQGYLLKYAFCPDILHMTNAKIKALAPELHISEFEFSRNHWAIKNADLFKVLFGQNVALRPVPDVFQLSENPINPSLVSIMMPFSARFDSVHQAIRSAVEGEGYNLQRADNFWYHPHIMQDIIELICISQVVICDLSGKNANVFYEAGVAHTLGKEVILITQHMDDVPFDLHALRVITYLNNDEGCRRLAADVVKRLTTVA